MKFPPTAIWVVLFALLACAAEGRGFGQYCSPTQTVDVCEAQARIASFSGEMAQGTWLVCDFQRALGAMDYSGTAPSDPGATALLVTVNSSRILLPSPALAAFTAWELASAGIAQESVARCANPVPFVSGPPPGLRFTHCLAPHAPPQCA